MNDPRATEFEIALSTTPGPEPSLDDCEELENLLLEHGQAVPRELVLALDKFIDTRAFRRAGQALRHLLLKLPEKSPASVALRRVLLGSSDESLRSAARKCRVSHVALLKREKRIRARLGYHARP